MIDKPIAFRLLWTCAIIVLSMCATRPSDAIVSDPERVARKILDDTGITGGLVVHIGCGDGTFTIALHANDRYLVHGLTRDPAKVQHARARIRTVGLTGKVTVSVWRGDTLPFLDNQVNLLVCEDGAAVTSSEITRVLAPRGVAYIRTKGTWKKTVKPWPNVIDEWTHYLHGPNNNAVASDTVVGPPFHIQWVGASKWARHHNYLSSTSAVVSAAGRIFAIIDVGPKSSIEIPPEWTLMARDAFSGVLLWKRPIGSWEGHLRRFRSGPTELPRRLVAVDDRVYVTLGYGRPVTALDAATGETVRSYAGTEETLEIVANHGILYLVIGDVDVDAYAESVEQRGPSPAPVNKRIRAVRADTGQLVWNRSGPVTAALLPTTLCVADRGVFFQNPDGIVRLDAATGKQVWFTPRPVSVRRAGWSTPTLVVYDDVVLCADRAIQSDEERRTGVPATLEWTVTPKGLKLERATGDLVAYSARDGRRLWSCKAALGYNSPPDLFVADGLVWVSTDPNPIAATFSEGRDPHTGEVKRRLHTDAAFTETHHHRCYRNKATDRYIVLGRTGVEFISLTDEPPLRNCWIRGACQYGVMPCNGLIYLPPHSCACYIQSKLSGFYALAPASPSRSILANATDENPLEHGPAYGSIGNPEHKTDNPGDWHTYRHDPGRSGRTDVTVPAHLHRRWQTALSGRLTAPVAANGIVCVASVDTHTVYALDDTDGHILWSFTAGGRIDSPPTLDGGLALFGCADGWVYGLRQSDGALVWRYRVAPEDRRVVSFGQLESVWPVTGSVLVRDGALYCTAGRSSYLDGGMWLSRLDPATGRLLGKTRLYHRDPDTGEEPEARISDVELPGALPDVLACDATGLYLRDLRMDWSGTELTPDVDHLYSPVGFLDDHWWHRTYWIFGTQVFGRASGWAVTARYVPSGRILATDGTAVYGYGREKVLSGGLGLRDVPMHLFKADCKVTPIKQRLKNNNKALVERLTPAEVRYFWSREIPLVARAMVLTKETLFTAGPLFDKEMLEPEPTFTAGEPSALIAVAADDGHTLAQYKLDAQPVFDGLIAVKNRIYLSTVAGTAECWSAK